MRDGIVSRLGILAAAALAVGATLGARPAAGQAGLDHAVDRARHAWLTHDVEGLVAGSDTVRLNLPGIARAASLRPGQAARLLGQYLKPSVEREFSLREVRQLASDHAYAEVYRRYVVRGTEEERVETAFLGFRLLGGQWQLREVRITP